MKHSINVNFVLFIATLAVITSCQKETSTSTGWDYNNVRNGGFEKSSFEEQRTGPGLVMIEGGTFTMGRTEEDVMEDNDNRQNRFTVSSFYMDRTEVTNFHWLEYVYWMKRVYNKTYPHIYKKSLPDTNCWRDPLSYREKFVEYYFRYPAYRDYPVVGVSWVQANDFCKWRTDRVNEYILVEQGIIKWHFADEQKDGGDLGALGPEATASGQAKKAQKMSNAPENMFNTESYLAGQYNIESGKLSQDKDPLNYKYKGTGYTMTDGKAPGKAGETFPRDPYQLNDFDPVYAVNNGGAYYQGKRNVRMEDGILLPNYRLPTEAEWEYAATGLLGNLDAKSENVDERRVYPWDGHYVRYDEEQFQGTMQANFVRGTGDHMGVAGALNDGADATTHVDAYWPNDFGLYNMAGNVSEWVLDTYRPSTSDLADGFMPFRGNMYQAKLMVPDGLHEKYVKTKENIYDVYGMKEFVNEYARVLYLSATQNALHPDSSFSSQIQRQKEQRSLKQPLVNLNMKVEGANRDLLVEKEGVIYVAEGDSLVFSNDRLFEIQKSLGWSSNGKNKPQFTKSNWVFTAGATNGFVPKEVNKKRWKIAGAGQGGTGTGQGVDFSKDPNYGDSVICVKFNQVGTTVLEYTLGNETVKKEICVLGSRDEFDALRANDYTKSISSKVISRQDNQKYKFNSLSKGYIANNKNFSSMDKARFEMIDQINAVLDTAIFLFNKDNKVKASSYLEKALFGNKVSTTFKHGDFRSEKDLIALKTLIQDIDQEAQLTSETNELGVIMIIKEDDSEPTISFTSVFAKDFMQYKFPNYEQDQSITTWLINLRNGLSEYTIESRGKQRWRNVTEEENIGRLNYRKDDYIDYLDGDLESSIFYNNQKRISDINNGFLSAKNTVYQSEHENRDLQGKTLSPTSSGWPTSLISDKSKVYKGGSWADRAYWLSSGNRRYLDQDKTSATIGFRCAMDRLGDQRNMNFKKRRRR